ncbi:MAG: hypothetical protein ABIO40_02480 [Devosia sp.]
MPKPAPTSTFIVIFATERWWIDLNGQSQGPFVSRESAVSEAKRFAVELARNGRRSEVRVADPGKKPQIVYQSAQQSMLGRTTALTNP